MVQRPIIGITMGDPAGNGSEISVKALDDPQVYDRCRPIIIGDACCMEKAVHLLGKEDEIKIHAKHSVFATVWVKSCHTNLWLLYANCLARIICNSDTLKHSFLLNPVTCLSQRYVSGYMHYS